MIETMTSAHTAAEVLAKVFGYTGFRGQQEQVIEHVIDGGDALVLMPTGGGKSMCYQIPALVRAGTAIVVSPLIALMQDQVDSLRQLGVRAAFLNSSLDGASQRQVEQDWERGELDLLYVAPERLLTPRFLDLLDRGQVALFAIDEAHCVSRWGHDFRREYRELHILHQRFPQVPRIALTATADARTQDDIAERLGLQRAKRFVASFNRPNIRYHVEPRSNARQQLTAFLAGHRDEAGIVYALSRNKVDQMAARLRADGIDALPYHAGLDAAERSSNQQRFLREDGVVMVATIAFGMGIDKPDVRFVAHLDLPRSMEGYYQETGRAGRDGLPADAWMIYGLADVVTLSQMLMQSEAADAHKRSERAKLESLLAFAEATQCRRQLLLAAFDEEFAAPCGNCDNCLQPPVTMDATEPARKLLSAIYRSGQRFGAGHVIDILRGNATPRVQQLGHDQQSTFGIGADMDVGVWRSICRQLLAAGVLATDPDGYGSLRLAAASAAILKDGQAVTLRKDVVRTARSNVTRRASSKTTTEAASLSAAEQPLWEALRALRATLAKEQGVPAYVIFHDATLAQMAREQPQSSAQLATISGIGERKLERYGEAFLQVLTGEVH